MKNTLITLSFFAAVSVLGCDGGGDKKAADGGDKKAADGEAKKAADGEAEKASAGAPAAEAAPAADAGPNCADAAKHVVGLLAPQGDDAFLKEADIPKLTEGCEKAGNLGTDPNTQCILEAKTIEEVDKCGDKGFDKLIKPWLM